uniref:Uncharacterized protein n=1 Tax=Oryza meridionalis TaxID=40149 RepID=A0A0E0E0J3_9ORYZ
MAVLDGRDAFKDMIQEGGNIYAFSVRIGLGGIGELGSRMPTEAWLELSQPTTPYMVQLAGLARWSAFVPFTAVISMICVAMNGEIVQP